MVEFLPAQISSDYSKRFISLSAHLNVLGRNLFLGRILRNHVHAIQADNFKLRYTFAILRTVRDK